MLVSRRGMGVRPGVPRRAPLIDLLLDRFHELLAGGIRFDPAEPTIKVDGLWHETLNHFAE